MAKGHGHNRKKETRRARAAKRAAGTVAPTSVQPLQAPATPRARGLEATRGPVSNAYRAWAADYGRRQAVAVAAQFDGGPVPADLFLLAPLTTRTVEAPGGEIVSVQMGLPLVATRAGGVAVAPDRLAIAALRLAADDAGGAMALLGLGHAPNLPPPDLLFAAQLPGEGMRGARAADALAWFLARALEEGEVQLEARELAAAAGEALALLRPNVAPREAARLDPAALADYEGYGDGADERPVPLDITAPPARGGLAGLPGGAYLHDDGTPLAPLLADLRDYVIGLWPYDYFGLEKLTAAPTAEGKGRSATLAALADLVRRLDDVLAQGAEAAEEALAAEGQPPAWIAEETAYYREARQALRETRTAQELLPRLGPILFDLEIPPADYAPETLKDEDEE
jgi:hypothetical protein